MQFPYPGRGGTPMPTRSAVVIGINYTVLAPSLGETAAARASSNPLRGAEADAQALAALLAETGYAVRTLLGPAATRAAILDALEEGRATAGADGLLLCYFAG